MESEKAADSMKVDYDTFRKWLEEQERLAGDSDNEWSKAFPECQQSIYRRGMWYAYRDAGQSLARFARGEK